jgi:galactoside O-acetyltransferase
MNTNVEIGASCGVIIIGNDCSVGANSVLRAADHRYERTDIPINKQGHTYGEIIIEDDVWIASNCVITSATIIRKGSIVSSGSVVKGEVAEYSIVSGVPAKLIIKRK